MIIASYAALALALQIMENILLPPQIVWLRFGIANIITIILLYKFNINIAVKVVIVRTVAASLLLGTFLSPPFWMSFGGGVASAVCMGLILKTPFKNYLGVIGLSIIGAMVHNLVQLIIAFAFLQFGISFLSYILPIIVISSIIFGSITGYISYKVLIP